MSSKNTLLACGLAWLALSNASCTVSVTTDQSSGSGSDESPEYPELTLEAGTPMAMVEVELPNMDNFILRATVPVPPNTWPAALVPAAVVDYDGSIIPAQVETVTRYADDSVGADVIEVLARVRRNPALAPGTRTTYEIQYSPHIAPTYPSSVSMAELVAGPTSIPSNLQGLLATPANLRILSKDVFGHTYETRPLSGANAKLYRYGEVVTQLRSYDVMKPITPVAGVTGTLDHFFGVHAYSSVLKNEDILLLDLRFNNGPDGNSGATTDDDPMGDLYFQNIEVQVPSCWVVLQDGYDPMFGTPYNGGGGVRTPIVKPIGDGTMHLMLKQGQMHRRLAIAPAGQAARAQALLDQAGLGFVKQATVGTTELLSWNYSGVARYFPQAHHLPTLDHIGLGGLRSTLTAEFQALRSHIENGTDEGGYPIVFGNLGWAHPYGVGYGGMTGGAEINLYQGVRTVGARSIDGYRQLMDLHRMYVDRQQAVLYHADGNPSQIEDWLVDTGTFKYVPFYYFNSKQNTGTNYFGYDSAPTFQTSYVTSNVLKPAYETNMRSMQSIDTQHLVRYTRNPKALVWLGNDALSKDDLWMAAENFHFEFHEHYNSQWQHVQGTGLLGKIQEVAANPGRGFDIGRGQGWGIDANIAAFTMSRDDAWRTARREWMTEIATVFSDGQADCSGLIQSSVISHLFGGQYRARQSIEAAILENALRGMRKRVFEGVDAITTAQLDDVLHDSFYGMISPMSWNPSSAGPRTHLAVGQLNYTPFCSPSDVPSSTQNGYLDNFQIWSSLAYAYELTSNPQFLNYTGKMLPSNDVRGELEAQGLENIYNRAAMLALVQDL